MRKIANKQARGIVKEKKKNNTINAVLNPKYVSEQFNV